MVGVKQSRFFKWFFADASYRYIRYFTAKIQQYYIALGADSGKSITAQLDYTRAENREDEGDDNLDQDIYGASISWYGKRSFVTGRYEESSDKYLPIEAIFTARKNDYRTRAISLTAGYRF